MQQTRQIALAALASLAFAQDDQSLQQVLSSQSQLASLNTILGLNPSVMGSFNNLQNVTVLAPDNNALEAVLNNTDSASLFTNSDYITSLLQYHILNGSYPASSFGNSSMFIPTHLTNTTYTNVTGGQRVEARMVGDNVTFFSALKQNASVVQPNVNFTGGTIHIVNGLLSIPGNVTETLIDANLTAAAGALRDANLNEPLGSQRDMTLFAPNNDAFNAIGNIVGNLTTEQLANILGYHAVNGTVGYSSTLTSNTTLTSMDGRDITISVINGDIYANEAKVTVPNILCENGVIHVIDQVLNPDNVGNTPDVSATTTTAAFTGATSGTTGVPFTSGISTPSTTFPAATSGGGDNAGAGASSTSSEGPAMPVKTAGAMQAAALFGGAAIYWNM
ncbi:FAS1 domain-containing protein [Xylariaceae sp. FL0016]|nr:FAS1 domain-containing protein [Xylariaceae sp. FL0016]